MNNVRQVGIVYITRSSVFLAIDNHGVVRYDFPKDAVLDVEIVSREAVQSGISQLLASIKGDASVRALAILASDLLFEKDIADERELTQELKTQDFLDTIPFENLTWRSYQTAQGQRVIGANRNFYEPILALFSQYGFTFDGVIPESLLSDTDSNLQTGLSEGTARNLIKNYETLRQYSMVGLEKPSEGSTQKKEIEKKNKRRFVLIAVFAVLFLTLIILLLRS